MIDHAAIKLRYDALDPLLDERGRRRFAAAEALAAGRGGVAAVSGVTGIARSTIGRGLAELRGKAAPDAGFARVRRTGGGRRSLVATDPTLLADLKGLVEPVTRGDPMAPLLWTAMAMAWASRISASRSIVMLPSASAVVPRMSPMWMGKAL